MKTETLASLKGKVFEVVFVVARAAALPRNEYAVEGPAWQTVDYIALIDTQRAVAAAR